MLDIIGADERSRTPDLLITNELLYQLSYIGKLSFDEKLSPKLYIIFLFKLLA